MSEKVKRSESPATRLLKNTLIIAIGKFSTQFLIFFLLPIYTQYIPSADYGVVDLILTYVTLFVPAITIQQDFAIFRYLIDARGDDKKIKTIMSSSILTMGRALALVGLIYIIAACFIEFPFKWLTFFVVVTTAFSNFFLQATRGIGKNVHYAIGCILAGVFTILINAILIVGMNVGAASILIASIVSNLGCILFLVLSLRLYRYFSYRAIDANLRKQLVRYAVPIIFNGIAWWVISVSDRSIISGFISSSASGIYAVANSFAAIINTVSYVFGLAWHESASLEVSNTNRDAYYSSVLNNMVRLFVGFCALVLAGIPLVFSFFAKSDYVLAYEYIPILAIGSLLNCFAGFYTAVYSAMKKTKNVMRTSLVAAAVNLIIDLVLIDVIEVYAAALSTLIAFLTMLALRHIDIVGVMKIKIKINTRIAFVSMIGLAAVCLAYYFLPANYVYKILIFIATAVFVLALNLHNIKSLVRKIKTKII